MKKIMFNDAYGLTEATIEGRKTMTRRAEFNEYMQREDCDADRIIYNDGFCEMWCGARLLHQIPTRYKVGEVVAVAQSYETIRNCMTIGDPLLPEWTVGSPGWHNKMFVKADLMPHRIRITGLRAERLQDISDEDCIKEGIIRIPPEMVQVRPFYFSNNECHYDTPREAFAALIDKVSGRGTWAINPWVVAYEYELVK